jgi:cyclopropane fatty-acyl-phospholipid synthase-like methyltransferase
MRQKGGADLVLDPFDDSLKYLRLACFNYAALQRSRTCSVHALGRRNLDMKLRRILHALGLPLSNPPVISGKPRELAHAAANSTSTAFADKAPGVAEQSLNENWNYADDGEKIYALGSFGIHPSDLDLIAKNRRQRADHIAALLDIRPNDVVLDLGSGMGFMAERLAPRCLQLHCADVSETYLADCRDRVAQFSNVETHLISYADLRALDGKGVSKMYAALLFIHVNFYDLTYYLSEAHRILNAGGLCFFDYNDGDVFRYDNEIDSFNEHLRYYRTRRLEWVFGCMQMTSGTTLRNLLGQIGFEVVSIHPSRSAFTEIVVRKVA